MVKLSRALIGCVVFVCTLAAHAGTPSGRWVGKIDVPGNPLDITVDLESTDEGRWVGDLGIPAQGLTNFPLTDFEIEGSSISFAMSGIPGEPVFRGTLNDDGSVLWIDSLELHDNQIYLAGHREPPGPSSPEPTETEPPPRLAAQPTDEENEKVQR